MKPPRSTQFLRKLRGPRFATFETLETRIALAADPLISEFLTANEGGFADGLNRSRDWIEIWNRGDEPVNLQNYALTDDPARPDRWVFPDVELAAGDYLVVFASGETDPTFVDPEGHLHTNFRLDRDGEYLAFQSPEGVILSQFGDVGTLYPQQFPNISYGLGQPNGTVGYLPVPTPGQANPPDDDVLVDYVRDTTFSVDRGFFAEPFQMEITSATPNASIRYTLDGTEPSLTNGMSYTEPIDINGTTVVRARGFRDSFLPTNIDTQTYLFLEDVLDQDGAGLPETWGTFPFGSSEARQGTEVPANYEVDPEVVNDPRYRDTILDDLRTLPTVSIVLPPDSLWDETTGIYSNPHRSGVDWERGGSIELIDRSGDTEFQIDAGIRMHGGFGRRPSATAKHSFRLFFKGEYGAAKLDYPWFGEDQVDEFDTIVLRAHYNYSWARGNRGGDQTGADYTMLNDRWANLAQQEMGGHAPNGAYVHLYVNGLYWGVYNPTERPDASFQASHRGGRKEDYDVQNHEGLVDGQRDAWRDLRRTVRANPVDMDAVEEILDVDNFIDYMILNQFGGNGDWPQNNWYASRLRQEGETWQFHVWDSEFYFVDLTADRIRSINNSGPGEIFLQLLGSDEFRVRFADRIQKHLFNGGALTLERNIARMDEIAQVIDRAIVGESARWGDAWMNQVNPPRTRDDDWLPRLQSLREDYFPRRHRIVIRQYQIRGLFPETMAPQLSPFGGTVQPGSTAMLSHENEAGVVYYTLDGSDPRNPDGSIADSAIMATGGPISINESVTLIARVWTADEWSARIEAPFEIAMVGDLNADARVDHADLDRLCALIGAGEFEPKADINEDQVLDLSDRDELLRLMGTVLGDVNSDGLFNSTDLISVFKAGEYEDQQAANSQWTTGDWNCDGEFDSSDLVAAFQRGAYSNAALARQ